MEREAGVLSSQTTVVALVNGMIGGIILVMPILALKSGSLMIAPVVLVCGFFSYYSCLLCISHLRNYKDLDEAVLKHFDNKRSYKIFYDVCIAISLIVLLILYFDLICKQWEGIIAKSRLIPLINAIVLFPAVYAMKKYNFGASLLAYGIVSTIGYCLFILYMWVNAPTGSKHLSTFDAHFPQLAAALGQGFSIQAFFIPILRKNERKDNYKELLKYSYVIGAIVYAFIGYGGSLSIVNKQYPGPDKPETITEYFGVDQWQVVLVQIIYLIHLYSAFPEFLLISKQHIVISRKRVFSFLDWPEQTDVTFKEVIYAGIIIFLCLIIKLTSLSAQTLIELNGSVISFIFIVVIPVGLHVKCVYFTDHRHHRWEDEIQYEKPITNIHNHNYNSSNDNDSNNNRKYNNKQIELQMREQQKQSNMQSSKNMKQERYNQNKMEDDIKDMELQIQSKNQSQQEEGKGNKEDQFVQELDDKLHKQKHQIKVQLSQQSKNDHKEHNNNVDIIANNPQTISNNNSHKPFSLQVLVEGFKSREAGRSGAEELEKCDIQFKSRAHKWCDLLIIVTMTISGLLTMGYTIYLIVLDHLEEDESTLAH